MNGNFLHHLWKLKHFNFHELKTTEGESVEILKTGLHNHDAGPDFFNALIKVGDTLWAGNVEIHLKSSDWKNHEHEKDKAYDNVILHVVYEDDGIIKRSDGSPIPTIELKEKFDHRLWRNYNELVHTPHWISCAHRISEVDEFTVNNWLDRMLTERLERKTETIFSSLESNNNNWEETFYQHLAKNFGFKVNAMPFELLAKSLPLNFLSKHKDHVVQLEAMLFGQAGMLTEELKDDYPNELRKEYLFLKNKFNLESIVGHQWKFLRLRPMNFPTVRIAQFAQLLHRSSHLFSKILECTNLEEIEKYFEVKVSLYWQTHFVFDKLSILKSKHQGESTIQNIIVNTVVPFLFAYGISRSSEEHQQRALQFLEEIPSEENIIISKWNDINIKSRSAYSSQALLQLKNEYCDLKKCLTCSIGNKIISNPS